jgi:hypothetical protein
MSLERPRYFCEKDIPESKILEIKRTQSHLLFVEQNGRHF